MGQIIHADFKPLNRQIFVPSRNQGKIYAQNQAIEVLDSGLDLMVTILTGDEWDALEKVRAIKDLINAKTVPVQSILIAKDLVRIAKSTIAPTQPDGGAA